MAFEYVVVKEEFDFKEDSKTEAISALENNEPEYNNKNNKMEIAASIPNKTRIKTELIDPPRSPDGSQTSSASWLVPIKKEVKEVLPETYVEVTVKEEVPGSEDIGLSSSKALVPIKEDVKEVLLEKYVEVTVEEVVPGSEEVNLSSSRDLCDGAGPRHVPGKEEVKEVLPENYVEVTIKEEVSESEDDQPGCEDISSDSSTVQQAPSSSDELDHQPSGNFACDICGKRYIDTAHLQRHLQVHSKHTVQCNQCNRHFLNKLRLNTHIYNRHTIVTPFPCDQCPNKFKSKYYLKEHKKTHLDKKPYQCSKCTQTFSVKCNLERHQNRNRCKKPSDGPIQCKICDNVFENESLLKSHMKEHDSERTFPCEECSTTFKQKSTLIRHMHVHTGIRPYPCPHCGKTFTSSGLLKPHLRVHTGEKPYSCKLCDKKFAHKHNMQRHMLGHEKIKHTVCDICHKEFPRESRLKYHMKTHVNEKYFLCKVCPKRFSHKQNVIRHYTRKHPGQTYQCTDTDASVAAKVWDTMKKRFCDEETEEILG